MNASVVALVVTFSIVAVGSFIGFYAGARYKMDLEQWTVAGRGFGALLVWLLMAGEIYTTFSFLGPVDGLTAVVVRRCTFLRILPWPMSSRSTSSRRCGRLRESTRSRLNRIFSNGDMAARTWRHLFRW